MAHVPVEDNTNQLTANSVLDDLPTDEASNSRASRYGVLVNQFSRILSQFRSGWPEFSRTTLPLLIVEAALVLGVVMRLTFFLSFPDPLPTADTWSYLTGAYGLLDHGQFTLYAQR